MSEKALHDAVSERDEQGKPHFERRESVLTDHDINRLKSAMFGGMTEAEHIQHHNVFRDYLEREKAKIAKRERMKGQFIGGLILGITGTITLFLGWVGTVVWGFIKDHWRV